VNVFKAARRGETEIKAEKRCRKTEEARSKKNCRFPAINNILMKGRTGWNWGQHKGEKKKEKKFP